MPPFEGQLYCKIFLDTPRERDYLFDLVESIVEGSRDLDEIFSQEIEIYVNLNDDRDPNRAHAPDDGFLYFPYFLDVDPAPSCDREQYVGAVRNLVKRLREHGMRPVAACDFEDEL